MIRPGSKAWRQLIQQLYGFCWAMLIIGLGHRYMSGITPDAETRTTLIWASRLLMYPSGFTLSLIFFVSAFAPVQLPLDWSIVYPALRKKK